MALDGSQRIDDGRVALCMGSLLHDVGDVAGPEGPRGAATVGKAAEAGSEFVARTLAASDAGPSAALLDDVKEQVRYGHAGLLASDLKAGDPKVPAPDSLAYVVAFADGIATGLDRSEGASPDGHAPAPGDGELRKVFNVLNGHRDENVVPHGDLGAIEARLREGLQSIRPEWRSMNELVGLLEETTSVLPARPEPGSPGDISIFDRAKVTCALALCTSDYLGEKGVTAYRDALFPAGDAHAMGGEEMFLLWSCDMSGIQDFIYNISGAGVLKQLRARSFYLEMLLESIVDELLERLGLCRANLLYTGGGHAYALLPKTKACREELRRFDAELEAWFLRFFRTDLYLASAAVACSADDLANRGGGQRYGDLYRRLSQGVSSKKASRYDAATIARLNFDPSESGGEGRECSECHRSDTDISFVDGKPLCSVCAALEGISPDLVRKDVFVVREAEGGGSWRRGQIMLPFDRELSVYSLDEYRRKEPEAVRVYVRNRWDAAIPGAIHIWMGSYRAKPTFEEYLDHSATLPKGKGAPRLGVLRADVDDLGAAFVSGFPQELVSLSRTSIFSRELSRFFKYGINGILEENGYQVQVIYAGGDDLFIVGNWSDVIFAALSIREGLEEFTGNGSLTLSAGIGMFYPHFPVARMASSTGELEDAAKLHLRADGRPKDAVALWSDDRVFGWDEFIGSVVPRYREVSGFFEGNEQGTAFIKRMLDLLGNFDETASAPRLAYLLARSFEDRDDCTEVCQRYFGWARDERERRYLMAALEWYVYSIRGRD